MTLREYIFVNRMTIAAFADKVDYTHAYVSNVINEHQFSGPKFRRKVHEATGGQVGLHDWPRKSLVEKGE